jgi:hypothetical protein
MSKQEPSAERVRERVPRKSSRFWGQRKISDSEMQCVLQKYVCSCVCSISDCTMCVLKLSSKQFKANLSTVRFCTKKTEKRREKFLPSSKTSDCVPFSLETSHLREILTGAPRHGQSRPPQGCQIFSWYNLPK